MVQANVFDAAGSGVDVFGVAVDAENSTSRGNQFRGDDRNVASARPAIKHTHSGADTSNSKQPFGCRTQRVTLACEPLAFAVRISPGILVGHASDRPTPSQNKLRNSPHLHTP